MHWMNVIIMQQNMSRVSCGINKQVGTQVVHLG